VFLFLSHIPVKCADMLISLDFDHKRATVHGAQKQLSVVIKGTNHICSDKVTCYVRSACAPIKFLDHSLVLILSKETKRFGAA
jgi:hypothetical protein